MGIKKEYVIYAAIVLASIVYLVAIEHIYGKRLSFAVGGQDLVFSPFDVVIVLISVIASVLVIVSFAAYRRRKNVKLFILAIAFLLFALKSILEVVDNFFLSGFTFLSVLKRVLELLVLLAFLVVLFAT